MTEVLFAGSDLLVGSFPSDVAGSNAAVLAPVRIPIRTVRTPGAACFAAPHRLEPVADLAHLARGDRVVAFSRGLGHQPSDKDQKSPEVVFVESSDLSNEVSINRHLMNLTFRVTQDAPRGRK